METTPAHTPISSFFLKRSIFFLKGIKTGIVIKIVKRLAQLYQTFWRDTAPYTRFFWEKSVKAENMEKQPQVRSAAAIVRNLPKSAAFQTSLTNQESPQSWRAKRRPFGKTRALNTRTHSCGAGRHCALSPRHVRAGFADGFSARLRNGAPPDLRWGGGQEFLSALKFKLPQAGGIRNPCLSCR